MQIAFYRMVIYLARFLGSWIFELFAWFVATGFFLLFPGRVGNSLRFYRVLLPGKNHFYYLRCAWRQFHNFTDVYFDRFVLQEFDDISYTASGIEHIEQAMQKKKGGILLMSHVGNWEVAAHLLKQKHPGMRLLLYMGIKHKEQIEGIQKESLSQKGIEIVAVDPDGGSPFDIVEGIRFIDSGGLVSLAGDIIWKEEHRCVPVNFLGQRVYIPEAPYLFALLSGAPLFVFFAFRTGSKQYHFTASEPIYVETASRAERKQVIHRAAQAYADKLADAVRQYPFQWYHFKPFLIDDRR